MKSQALARLLQQRGIGDLQSQLSRPEVRDESRSLERCDDESAVKAMRNKELIMRLPRQYILRFGVKG